MEDYLLFAGILVVGQFTPGPDLLLITRNALAAERAGPALATALGVCAGLVAHTAAAFGGLGLAVQAMPDLQAALSVAGALYLAYLGVQLVRAAWFASAHEGGGDGAGGAVPLAAGKAFAQGLFTNLLNPKVLLFFTGMSARFAADATPAGRWAFAGIALALGWLLWPAYALLLRWHILRGRYRRWERPMNAAFGLLLLTAAASLVLGW